MEFLELASEYYYWDDSKTRSNKLNYSLSETPHFLIYYPSEFTEDKIKFISNESENVFNTLFDKFKPDSLMLDNLNRLRMYESWENKNFKENTGALKSSNGKFIVVLTNTRQQMLDIIGTEDHDKTAGYTLFSQGMNKEDDKIYYTCVSYLNFISTISMVRLTHELTHAFTFTMYSQPLILEKAMKDMNTSDLSKITEGTWMKFIL
jgi:hypothetical protein